MVTTANRIFFYCNHEMNIDNQCGIKRVGIAPPVTLKTRSPPCSPPFFTWYWRKDARSGCSPKSLLEAQLKHHNCEEMLKALRALKASRTLRVTRGARGSAAWLRPRAPHGPARLTARPASPPGPPHNRAFLRAAASLQKAMGTVYQIFKSVVSASLHKSTGAASLQKSMGTASLHKSVSAASLHKSMGAASLHKSVSAASLHKSMGAAFLHKSVSAASLHKSMGAAFLHKSRECSIPPQVNGCCIPAQVT